MDPLEVHQIGRYQLLDVIGKGGMGIVYRAIDTTIERKVAIKMLLGGRDGGDADLLTRFYREVRFTANLQHKNIVTVYALDDLNGLPYMVMEYLEGKSIAELIASQQPLSIIDKLGLICQVCEGLQYAHDRNVIHRDVKPANILVQNDGVAKIVDFGIARVELSSSITRTGQIVGSMYYMSPEQTNGSVDTRSDIYSTGVTLFEFLTGEVPFKGVDLSSTLQKIAKDPVPPLSKYLATYPKILDSMLAKAMAKDATARYQTAEDFAYDLAQLLDSLKREMADEFLALARKAIADQNLDLARQKLQDILKVDRRNSSANELYRQVREQIQIQQRSAQIEHLKAQADLALAGQQYEEALECIEQAKRLAPDDQTLATLSDSIQRQIERARELSDALRQGQAALYAGDLNEAGQAVKKALEIDSSNTQARTLETLVRKELEDRTRRAQLQGFLDEARREIASKNFLSALQALQKAQTIDPTDSNIKELLNWAASGHEQEKLRNELRKYTDEVSRLVAEDQFSEAVNVAQLALQKFPSDAALIKLYELAGRQQQALKRRRIIEDSGAKARTLIDTNKEQDAIRLLESALAEYPADPNLEMLLEIARTQTAQNEDERKDREWRALQISRVESSFSSSERRGKSSASEFISLLESSLSRKLPVFQLAELALRANEIAKQVDLHHEESQRLKAAITELNSRVEKEKRDLVEVAEIKRRIQLSTDSMEAESLADRARLIVLQYPRDETLKQEFDQIRALASDLKIQRDRACAEISSLLHAMQISRNYSDLKIKERLVQQTAEKWPKDEFIHNLVDQADACVQDAERLRVASLKDLEELSQSVSTARSRGQLRFIKGQIALLGSEVEDDELSARLEKVRGESDARLKDIDNAVLHFAELRAKASSAASLSEAQESEGEARRLLETGTDFEETVDSCQQISRIVEERKKDYRRIWTSLEQLMDSSKSAGKSELEAIVGRTRILLGKYPRDRHFQTISTNLDNTIAERRRQLVESSALEEIDEFDSTESEGIALAPDVAEVQAVSPQSSRRRLALLISVAVGLSVCLGITFIYFFPRTMKVTSDPSAIITVGDQTCRTPCSLRLRPGKYQLSARANGYREADPSIEVSLLGQNPVTSIPLTHLAATESSQIPPKQEDLGSTIPDLARTQASMQLHGVHTETSNSASPDENVGTGKPPKTADAQPSHTGSDAKPTFPSVEQPPPRVEQPVLSLLGIQAPLGAEVHIDEQVAGHSTGAALKVSVPPGSHTIEVFLPGYEPFRKTIVAEQGQEKDLNASLQPIPPVAPPPSNPGGSSAPGSVSAEDRSAIQETINRYTSAVNQRDAKQLRAAWPDIPKNQFETLRNFGRDHKGAAISMVVTRIGLLPGGEDAIVTARQTSQFDGSTSTGDVTFYMKKLTGGWIITLSPPSN